MKTDFNRVIAVTREGCAIVTYVREPEPPYYTYDIPSVVERAHTMGERRVIVTDLADALTVIAYKNHEIAKLKEKLISGFYEEEVPQFDQGEPTHELQDLVTAEEVTGYVQHIKRLRDVLEWLDVQGGLGYEKHRRIEIALKGEQS